MNDDSVTNSGMNEKSFNEADRSAENSGHEATINRGVNDVPAGSSAMNEKSASVNERNSETTRTSDMSNDRVKKADYTLDDLKRDASKETEDRNRGRKLQLIIFKLGNEEYGLTIDQIKEIVLTPNVAKMPQTPAYIKGVANIRGNIIAIMDMEKKFGLSKSSDNDPDAALSNYTLVVESDTFKAGILVNHVPNTLAVYETDIDYSSNFLQYSSIDENYITGIVKSGNRMIILVDMIKLMEGEASSVGASINKAINN